MQKSILFSIGWAAILFLSFSLFTGCFSLEKNSKDLKATNNEIRSVLYKQQEAWNQGNIPLFMEGYWKSPELRFCGSSGLTKGWQATLERYTKSYPDKAAMGKLEFEIIDLRMIDAEVALMNGKFTLFRTEDQPSGYFTLVWEKIKGQWYITADHTS